jgi:hypothetical protein
VLNPPLSLFGHLILLFFVGCYMNGVLGMLSDQDMGTDIMIWLLGVFVLEYLCLRKFQRSLRSVDAIETIFHWYWMVGLGKYIHHEQRNLPYMKGPIWHK